MRCQTFCISERAVDAWEKLHVQTEAAIVMFFTVGVVIMGLYAYLFVGKPADGVCFQSAAR